MILNPDVVSERAQEFEDFYSVEFSPLVTFVVRLGIPYEEAKDAAQTAFVELYLKWADVHNPHAWLRTVARRTVWKRVEIRWADLLDEDVALIPDDFEVADQTWHVFEALSRLPPIQRAIMALRYDGFKPVEIARELDVSPESVRKNLQRARQALRADLSAREGA